MPSLRHRATPASSSVQPSSDVPPSPTTRGSAARRRAPPTPRRRLSGWTMTWTSMVASLTPSRSWSVWARPAGSPSTVASHTRRRLWAGVPNRSPRSSWSGIGGSSGSSTSSTARHTASRPSISGASPLVTSTTSITPVVTTPPGYRPPGGPAQRISRAGAAAADCGGELGRRCARGARRRPGGGAGPRPGADRGRRAGTVRARRLGAGGRGRGGLLPDVDRRGRRRGPHRPEARPAVRRPGLGDRAGGRGRADRRPGGDRHHQDGPHPVHRPRRPRRLGRARCDQPRPHPGPRPTRPALRPRPVEPAGVHDRRQRGEQLGRPALPGLRGDQRPRAGARGGAARRGGHDAWAGSTPSRPGST